MTETDVPPFKYDQNLIDHCNILYQISNFYDEKRVEDNFPVTYVKGMTELLHDLDYNYVLAVQAAGIIKTNPELRMLDLTNPEYLRNVSLRRETHLIPFEFQLNNVYPNIETEYITNDILKDINDNINRISQKINPVTNQHNPYLDLYGLYMACMMFYFRLRAITSIANYELKLANGDSSKIKIPNYPANAYYNTRKKLRNNKFITSQSEEALSQTYSPKIIFDNLTKYQESHLLSNIDNIIYNMKGNNFGLIEYKAAKLDKVGDIASHPIINMRFYKLRCPMKNIYIEQLLLKYINGEWVRTDSLRTQIISIPYDKMPDFNIYKNFPTISVEYQNLITTDNYYTFTNVDISDAKTMNVTTETIGGVIRDFLIGHYTDINPSGLDIIAEILNITAYQLFEYVNRVTNLNIIWLIWNEDQIKEMKKKLDLSMDTKSIKYVSYVRYFILTFLQFSVNSNILFHKQCIALAYFLHVNNINSYSNLDPIRMYLNLLLFENLNTLHIDHESNYMFIKNEHPASIPYISSNSIYFNNKCNINKYSNSCMEEYYTANYIKHTSADIEDKTGSGAVDKFDKNKISSIILNLSDTYKPKKINSNIFKMYCTHLITAYMQEMSDNGKNTMSVNHITNQIENEFSSLSDEILNKRIYEYQTEITNNINSLKNRASNYTFSVNENED